MNGEARLSPSLVFMALPSYHLPREYESDVGEVKDYQYHLENW